MSQPRRWCFYNVNSPHQKQNFDEQMCYQIEQAFTQFITNKVNHVQIGGVTFDFDKMECNYNGGTFKLSSNDGFVPYKVKMGDITAVPLTDLEFLKKVDQSKIGHHWFWWGSTGTTDPFTLFKRYGETNPMWTYYSPADESRLEELYAVGSQNSDHQPLNQIFGVRFDCTYENTYKVMVQGRNDDENDPSKPEQAKRRRPIFRSTFCWFWDSSDGSGNPVWEPYSLEISTYLENALFARRPEVDFATHSGRYTVNFSQGVQFNVMDVTRKRRIKRFGTEYVVELTQSIGTNANDMVPPYWEKGQQTRFLATTKLIPDETNLIYTLINNSNRSCQGGPFGSYYLSPTSATRLQNFDVLEQYYGKKTALRAKNIPSFPSTALLNSNGAVQTFPVEQNVNEFYMWHFTTNIQGLLAGHPLKQAYDQGSRGARKEKETLFFSENIRFEDAMNPYSQSNQYFLVLCRVILGDCYLMGAGEINAPYNMSDIPDHPPVNPRTGKAYDSVMYIDNSTGVSFKRVAIYDVGQIYPEHVVCYARNYIQGYNYGGGYNQ